MKPYEEAGKIYKCCENVWKVYQESQKTKGTQMIFYDMATPKGSSNKSNSDTDTEEFGSVDMESAQLYDDMKARMVQLGIPAKEVAFIHDAKNDKQKATLAQKRQRKAPIPPSANSPGSTCEWLKRRRGSAAWWPALATMALGCTRRIPPTA